MSTFLFTVALFLLLNVAVGLVRVIRGPTAADRIIAAYLFGTTATATLMLLAAAEELRALLDVALVFVLLAAVAVTVFVTVPFLGER